LGVDIDPDTAGFIALGSGDDHTSIPTAEVVEISVGFTNS
jgi:hypothetical protein